MGALSTKVWDIIMTSGSTTIGLMEPKGKNGSKPSSYQDGQIIPSRQMTDSEVTEAQYPPTVQLPLPQGDWRVGMGRTHRRLDIAAFGGTTIGYTNGLKVDASGEAKVKLARKFTVTASAAALQGTSTKFWAGMGAIGVDLWLFRDSNEADFATKGYKWSDTNGNWVSGPAIVAGNQRVIAPGVAYKDNLYFAVWGLSDKTTATAYCYIAEGGVTFTTSTLTPNDFYFLAVDADNLFYGAYRPTAGQRHHVYTTTDPTNAGVWTGPYAVGESGTEITAIVPYGKLMLICKPEGLYTIDSTGAVRNLSRDIFYGMRHNDNFRNAKSFAGGVLLPLGDGGLWELDANENLRDISFRKTMPEQTYLHGNIVDIAIAGTYVYAAVVNSTDLYILKAEWLDINGVTDYRWHVEAKTTWSGTTIDKYRQFLFSHSTVTATRTYRRVWVSRVGTSAINSVGNDFLPRLNDVSDLYTTDSDAIFDTVIEDAYLPNENKNCLSVICTTNNLSSGAGGHTIPVDYSVDDGAFTSLGTLNSDSQTLTFSAITGKKMVLRFKPLLGTPDGTSPELLDCRIVVQVRPPPSKLLPIRVVLGDGVLNRLGGRETRSGSKRAQLRTWDAAAGAVTVKSSFVPAGDSYLFLANTMRERIISQKRGERPVYQVDLVLLEI